MDTIQCAKKARHVQRRGDRSQRSRDCRVRGGPPRLDPNDGLVTYRISRSTATAAPYHTALKSILIADGNESVAELFAYVFASHDWNVTRYSDGRRASEELCGSTHYDAVLVSYRFDGM